MELRKSLATLKAYIEESMKGRVEFSLDIPTQIAKILFDRTRWNKNITLLERVCKSRPIMFHPLLSPIPANIDFSSHSPAGTIHFRGNKIILDLFDLTAQPISLETWQQQTVQISNGIRLSIYDFVCSLRDKESAHSDPLDDPKYQDQYDKLMATKGLIYNEGGKQLTHEKVMIALGGYVVNRLYEEVLHDTDAIIQWGNELRQMENYDNAIVKFDKAIDIDPQKPEAHYGKAVCLYRLQKFQESIDAFTKVLSLIPNHVGAIEGIGVSLGALKRYEESIEYFQKTTSMYPSLTSSYYNWGLSLIGLGVKNDALDKLEKAIEIPEARYRMATILLERGSLQEAKKHLEQLVKDAPEFADGWFWLGKIHESENNLVSAVVCLRRARDLNSSFSTKLGTELQNCKIVVLDTLKLMPDNSFKPQIASKYECNFGTLVSTPTKEKAPLILGVDAEGATINSIYKDADFFVIASDLYDLDLSVTAERLTDLRTWLVKNQISEGAIKLLLSRCKDLCHSELYLEIKNWFVKLP